MSGLGWHAVRFKVGRSKPQELRMVARGSCGASDNVLSEFAYAIAPASDVGTVARNGVLSGIDYRRLDPTVLRHGH